MKALPPRQNPNAREYSIESTFNPIPENIDEYDANDTQVVVDIDTQIPQFRPPQIIRSSSALVSFEEKSPTCRDIFITTAIISLMLCIPSVFQWCVPNSFIVIYAFTFLFSLFFCGVSDFQFNRHDKIQFH